MDFWIRIVVSFIFYNQVVVSESSVLSDNISTEENDVLERFFVDNIFSENQNPRLLTIVGASRDQIDQLRPLLKSFPNFLAEDGKKICNSRELSPDTFVMQFFSNFKADYVTRVLEKLENCKHNYVFFIFEGTAITERDIELLLRLAFERISKVPILLNYRDESAKMYGYGVVEGCSKSVQLITNWIPGIIVNEPADNDDEQAGINWTTDYRLEACPIKIAVINSPPWMDLEEDENGSLKIIGGFDGDFISIFSNHLNITTQTKIVAIPLEVEGIDVKNLVESCAAGNTTIGMAHLRPTKNVTNVVDVSKSYQPECVVWCVPRITRWKFNIMTSEFSSLTWLFVSLTFLASFAVETILRKVFCSTGEIDQKSDQDFFSIILDMVSTTLGYPIAFDGRVSSGRKILLLSYLLYATVITTAYKTFLASLLTVENEESIIVDLRGIIEANLTTGGDEFGLEILEDQREYDEAIPVLIGRYTIERDTIKALRRISDDKDFAFLTTISSVIFYRTLLKRGGEFLSFDVLDGCVLTYSPVIIFPKISRFRPAVDELTQRLNEAGFITHLLVKYFGQNPMNSMSTRSSATANSQDELMKFNRENYFSVFTFYCIATGFCSLVFVCEIISRIFKSEGTIGEFKENVE